MPYKCHHCEQCFKIKPPWLKHMKEAHDKKPFICDEVDCNFSFRSLDLLKRHKKKHLESRLGRAQRITTSLLILVRNFFLFDLRRDLMPCLFLLIQFFSFLQGSLFDLSVKVLVIILNLEIFI